MYFDTAADRFYFCNGTSWEAAAINPLAINDSGIANTDLWSAQKIQSAIDAAVFGIGEFLESVLDKITTPPASPTNGNRFNMNYTIIFALALVYRVALLRWMFYDKVD